MIKFNFLFISLYWVGTAGAQQDSLSLNFEHLKTVKEHFVNKPLKVLFDSTAVSFSKDE